MLGLSDTRLELLVAACRYHTVVEFSDDATIATCWDADRLDLWRVGIDTNPERMNTVMARSPDFINRCGSVWL